MKKLFPLLGIVISLFIFSCELFQDTDSENADNDESTVEENASLEGTAWSLSSHILTIGGETKESYTRGENYYSSSDPDNDGTGETMYHYIYSVFENSSVYFAHYYDLTDGGSDTSTLTFALYYDQYTSPNTLGSFTTSSSVVLSGNTIELFSYTFTYSIFGDTLTLSTSQSDVYDEDYDGDTSEIYSETLIFTKTSDYTTSAIKNE